MRLALLFIFFIQTLGVSHAQVAIESSDSLPEQLESLLLENSAMDITGFSFSGDTAALGIFNRVSGPFPLDYGLVISSGTAEDATTGSFTNNEGADGDVDLESLSSSDFNFFDCSALEISFVATQDELNLSFVFASDEYAAFTCSNFADPFGIFIKKDQEGEIYDNIAFVPETTIPVTINSINAGPENVFDTGQCEEANPDWEDSFVYYLQNPIGEYGHLVPGLTVALPAVVPLEVGEEYVLKLAIGDMADPFFNSYGFLSFSGGNDFDCPLSELNVGDTCLVNADTLELIGLDCDCTLYQNGVDFAIDLNPNFSLIDPGDTVLVEATVQNYGPSPSGDFILNLYRSLDFTLDEDDELLFSQTGSNVEFFTPQYFEFSYADYPIPYQSFRLIAELVSEEDSDAPLAQCFVNFPENTPCEVSVNEEYSPLYIDPEATEVDFEYSFYNPGPSEFDEMEIRVYWSQGPTYVPVGGVVTIAEIYDAFDVLPGDSLLVETTLDIPEEYTGTDAYMLVFPKVGTIEYLDCMVVVDVISGFLSSSRTELSDWKAWIDPSRGLVLDAGSTAQGVVSINLYDGVGRLVLQEAAVSAEAGIRVFPLPQLSSGIYLLSLKTETGGRAFKLAVY